MLRTRTVWGPTAAVVVCLGLLSACGADDPTVGSGGAAAERPTGPRQVLLFGDSVAGLVADELAEQLSAGLSTRLHVDAVDCRRLDRGFAGPCGGVPAGATVPPGLEALRTVVDDLRGQGVRPDAAVVVIANNAALDAGDLDAAMQVLRSVPRVWWVTTDVEGRGWRDPNNARLHELADRDERARVVDWFAAADGRDWRADHVHPDDDGQAALAELIADHLRCDCPG